WRKEFKVLFKPVIEQDLLPRDVSLAVTNYLDGTKAASCSDDKLYRVLRRYDKNRGILVEHLAHGDVFELSGKIFVLGKKLRTRYECCELKSGRVFRVLGVAEIEKLIRTSEQK